jgi:hypothetical protein
MFFSPLHSYPKINCMQSARFDTGKGKLSDNPLKSQKFSDIRLNFSEAPLKLYFILVRKQLGPSIDTLH